MMMNARPEVHGHIGSRTHFQGTHAPMTTPMIYNPAKHHRRSIRLKGYDYSLPGYYFITVCSHDRACLFGHIDDSKMQLNEFGKIVRNEWDKSFVIRRELLPDEFVVMPNHFHGIVRVVGVVNSDNMVGVNVETSVRTSLQGNRNESDPPRIRPKSISSFMAGVKSVITYGVCLNEFGKIVQ
jgi:REP element-mobilizing transposase RayT